jgi:hypothetical protein
MAEIQRISSDRLLPILAARGVVLTDRRLRQLADEGFFPAPVNSDYEFLATLLGLIQHYHKLREKQGGTLAAERLRKLKEEADKVALENDKTRGKLVDIEAVYRHFQGIYVALRARILASNLDDQEKDEILNDLRRLKARDVSEPGGDRDDPSPATCDPDPAAAD